MKKLWRQKKFLMLAVVSMLFLLTGCSSEKAFLELENNALVTNEAGNATIKGETNSESSLTIDGKTVDTDEGTFSYKVSLNNLSEKTIVVAADFDGEEIEEKVTIQPSDQFIQTTERAEAETALALAEKNPNQENYDTAFTLIASLSNQYDDIDQRLEVIKEHIPILTALSLAEEEETRENFEKAQAQVELASLNKEKLVSRLNSVEKNIVAKEEAERKTAEAIAAVEKAELTLIDEDYQHALDLINNLPAENTELSNRATQVKNSIEAKKAEEQRLAEEAAQAAAAAQAEANTATPVAQTVLVTPTGSKYHTRKCGNGTYTEATLDAALARGLEPCSKCFP